MKPVILAAICGGMLMTAAGQQAEARVRFGKVVLQLYYNAQTATILRSNNVQQVTSPSTGTYCITPIKPVDAHAVYPLASAEYLNNNWYPYAGYIAWQDTTIATDCAAGDLEVRTIYGGGTQPGVSFSLLVFQ